ncbi:MAG: putative transcriptional regulator, MarR family [Pseudarthrobacter sp.]|nr:putative transcriptional regulator, MarR family [Pseudarthrobacter sp.]
MVNRPIGFWVKQLDAALESLFDSRLARLRLTRRQWEVLGLLYSGPASPAKVMGVARSFGATDGSDGQERDMAALVGRNLIALLDGNLTLTAAGSALHAETSRRIDDTRRELTAGIGTDEYAMAVSVLERMSRNADRLAAP